MEKILPIDKLFKSYIMLQMKKTNFHDIGDRIELWLDEYGDENIIEYIKNTKNPYLIGTLIGKNQILSFFIA